MSEPMIESDGDKKTPGAGVVGLLIACLFIIAGLAAFSALSALVNNNPIGVGICCIASALPLGFLLNALLRK